MPGECAALEGHQTVSVMVGLLSVGFDCTKNHAATLILNVPQTNGEAGKENNAVYV